VLTLLLSSGWRRWCRRVAAGRGRRQHLLVVAGSRCWDGDGGGNSWWSEQPPRRQSGWVEKRPRVWRPTRGAREGRGERHLGSAARPKWAAARETLATSPFHVCGSVRGKEQGAGLAKLGIERISYFTLSLKSGSLFDTEEYFLPYLTSFQNFFSLPFHLLHCPVEKLSGGPNSLHLGCHWLSKERCCVEKVVVHIKLLF
jgi:hypothetical protein